MPSEKYELDRNVAERIPKPVCGLIQQIAAAGGRAWLVGGTVRDLLLGEQPDDWDVGTDLLPDRVTKVLPAADLRDRALGACRVRIPDLVSDVVITTLRGEADYRDHRHPERVWFVRDPAEDAARRDFTVNAIYLDVLSGTLIDPTGGIAHLGSKTLTMIGDPQARLREDALRLLRAWRFESRLGFDLDPGTAQAVQDAAALLHTLSAERVFDELTRAFTGPGRGRALRRGIELGLFAEVLPEVPPMDGVEQPPQYHPEGDVLTHVCLVLDHVESGSPIQAWAAVLHDVGKPPTFVRATDRIRFDGHDTLSARMADDCLRRLRAPSELRETVVEICRDHIRIASIMLMRKRRREAWLRDPRFAEHLAFHRADVLGSNNDLSLFETIKNELAELPPLPQRLLGGADVVALGVPQGPVVGALLRQLEERLDEHPDRQWSRPEALSLLRDIVEARIKTDP